MTTSNITNPISARAAIVGASGYTALELAKILLRHPHARLTLATTRQEDSPRLDALHPTLAHRTPLVCREYDPDLVAETADIAFLALPHTASLAAAPDLLQRGVKVIDLSADYRLKDAQVYQDWYGHTHTDPDGLQEAVYGLPELFREAIRPARLVANPGCYTSASILGLAPLIAQKRIAPVGIVIDAKSGVSGAGRTPKLNTHFPECNENFSAYNVGRHRHTPEIDQILTSIAPEGAGAVEVVFTPHLVPMDRGIFATIYADPVGPAVEHDLMELYRDFYAHSPFIRIVNHLPGVKESVHTNFCDITVRVVRGKILVIACLDNLIKGASGVAIQNMNLLLGLPETTGL